MDRRVMRYVSQSFLYSFLRYSAHYISLTSTRSVHRLCGKTFIFAQHFDMLSASLCALLCATLRHAQCTALRLISF